MIARVAALLVVLSPTVALAAPGNAWHIPDHAEAGYASMRSPLAAIDAGTDVVLVSGNQASGPGGNPGNQLQNGSAVLHRALGTSEWAEADLLFDSNAGNNVYYTTEIAAGSYAAGETVQYYLRIPYSDHDTTYVFGDDGDSSVSISEVTAQQGTFTFPVRWPLQPAGEFVSHVFGDVEARAYVDSGHVELVGPDRAGDPAGVTLVLQPLQASFAGRWQQGGQLVGAVEVGDGLEFQQVIGTRLVSAQLTSPADGVVRIDVTDWDGTAPDATRAAAASPTDEHVYGFGEKFNTLDQVGNTVHVMTADPPGDKGDLSYKVAPWFLSTRGFGVLLRGTAESWFDMRDGEADRWTITNLHGDLSLDVIWGPQPLEVMARYTGLTGRPELPPPWVFAPWMSSDHWRTGGEVRYVVTRMVELGLPTGVFVFDSPWETAYNDFHWNMAQFSQGGSYDGQQYEGFASVGEMMGFLRSHGLRVVVWLTPFVNVSSNDENVPGQNLGQASNYAEAAAAGYFVRDGANGPPLLVDWWKGTGSPVDFTQPAARTWFRDQLSALVTESDGVISGFKIDDGEATYIPLSAHYGDGRTGLEMRNGYTVEYHETVGEVLGADGVLFSRSGFVGTGAYPAAWAGDNEPNFGDGNGLPSVIVAGLSAAISGIPIWSHDVGGYQDTNFSATPENLFMRWAQFGALSPIMQMHRQVGAGLQYPWSFGDEGLATYRETTRLHTELFPYLYSHAALAATEGLPILRPLVLEFPDDPEVWPVNHTYLFGDAFLVAPMLTNNQTERTVYLPEGTWIDWWTHARSEGPMYLEWSDADQHHFPLLLRAGAIVPRLTHVPQTLLDADEVDNPRISTPDGAWSWLLVPAIDASTFAAYDGTTITLTPDTEAIGVDLSGPARTTTLELLADVPLEVVVDDRPLAQLETRAALEAAQAGWALDGDAVLAKFEHADAAQRVEFRYLPGGADESGGSESISGTGAATSMGDDPSEGGNERGSSDTAGVSSGAADQESSSGCACHLPAANRNPTRITLGLLMVALLATRRRANTRRVHEPYKA